MDHSIRTMTLNIDIPFRQLGACPLCYSRSLELLITLPNYPLTEFLVDIAHVNGLTLDNSVAFCAQCSHAFLSSQIDPGFLYSSNYRTSSKTDSSFSVFERLFDKLDSFDVFSEKKMVIDIGANDGTFLRYLKNKLPSKRFYGIDPIWNSEEQTDKIEGFTGFFDSEEAISSIPEVFPRLYLATHVLEHIASPQRFLEQFAKILAPGDQLLLVFPSLEGLVYDSRIESVHHQHFHYFSHKSFELLCEPLGLRIVRSWIDFEHYGAACVLVSRKQEVISKHDGWGEFSSTLGFSSSPSQLQNGFADSKHLFDQNIEAINLQLSLHRHVGIGGGALMSPILFYYLQPWSTFEHVYDDDKTKVGLHYANSPRAIEMTPQTLRGKRVVVLGSVSKQTGRKLFLRATQLEAHSIAFPVIGA